MNNKILSVFSLILILFFVGCTNDASKNEMETFVDEYLIEPFIDINLETEYFELVVSSNEDFVEGEPLSFISLLRYRGNEIVNFEGGVNTVILYITDLNGVEMHNIGYNDLAFEKMIEPGTIFEKSFLFDGLDAGEYYLFVESSWISINGEYQHGVGYEDLIKRKNVTSKHLLDIFKSKMVVDKYKIIVGSKR